MNNKILPVLFLGLAGVFLSSCSKILDKTPTDFVEPQNYYNSESDLRFALAGVYDPLGSEYLYASSLWFQLGNCTDESFYPNSSNSFSAPMFYQFDYTNPYISGLWQDCYKGIERANLLIENIGKPVMDESKRQAILGEALFLRAYYHFLLVSNFGTVLLKTHSTTNVSTVDLPATPAKQVYEQVLQDMREAEAKLEDAATIGNSSHVSKTAAQATLARVCLYMAGNPLNDKTRYAEALEWARKVVVSGQHRLLEDFDERLTNSAYSQIFINQAQDIYDIGECMWEADFNMNQANTAFAEGGRLGTYQISCTNIDTGYGSGGVRTTISLYNLYGNGDLRRDWAIAPFTFQASGSTLTRVPYTTANIINRECGKWRRYFEPTSFIRQQYRTGQNFPIVRYADVLLMLAEADNEVNSGPTAEGYEALNQVRRRGYGVPVHAADAAADAPGGLSQQDFRRFIMEERSRELCFEGLRKPDLIRWGVFYDVLTATAAEIQSSNASATNKARWVLGYTTAISSPKYLLLPIPALEININKAIRQNPGW
ncbi:RagB/SusD family nutrient uptake outer membrane protein [Niabella beijingensis]|uniref:RagB/SusD family nutrient uptake outer membrane protein n=1 Tax=Niabella beijingensis TaxID=2872700 RepID=UPI001CC00140|nr:RagB/SusD family nutrient uptake outer membrane protein [Niabella beijingensis]MBZ4191413.1 RagB/SusD family nutrient uptake outer membrane protein [Niabella beijingensis]